MAAQSSFKLVPRCRHLTPRALLLTSPRARSFSSFDESSLDQQAPTVFSSEHSLWPDSRLGLLSPQDPRFPLPGAVGQPSALRSPAPLPVPQTIELPPSQQDVIMSKLGAFVMPPTNSETSSPRLRADKFELTPHSCPGTVRRDMAELFPGLTIESRDLTVVIVSRRTQHDMSAWSAAAEEEREALLSEFMSRAEQGCIVLQAHGFWSDFIDPSCGRPYLGPHTNATMFETDERYRHFGLRIEDLGCCKVVSHPSWGTHAYVGALFTDAPADHPILKHI